MPMITIKDLTFGYDGSDKILFNDVSLTIDTTWKLALAGRNGRGKTTFFKLLKGELDHEGTINGVPTVIEFPMDTLPDTEDWKVRKELNLMGADPDAEFTITTNLDDAQGIDPVTGNPSPVTLKIIRNGLLFIEPNGRIFNAQGKLIDNARLLFFYISQSLK